MKDLNLAEDMNNHLPPDNMGIYICVSRFMRERGIFVAKGEETSYGELKTKDSDMICYQGMMFWDGGNKNSRAPSVRYIREGNYMPSFVDEHAYNMYFENIKIGDYIIVNNGKRRSNHLAYGVVVDKRGKSTLEIYSPTEGFFKMRSNGNDFLSVDPNTTWIPKEYRIVVPK